MKKMGRKHRPYFRIVAIDSRQPRDGRVIEELGSYDPMVRNTDERVRFKPDRMKYWLGVGAQPSEHVAVFIRKYMKKFEEQAAAAAAAPAPPAAGEAAPPAAEGHAV
jgi:small subunit ribosomal protein S16